MENKKRTSKPSTNKLDRRRGRPAGKNRVPLSIEERRARNAQYERERRNETAEAMAQLAEAAGCDSNIANAELLATVVNQLQRRQNKKHSLDDLKRINSNLESQIALLESRLAGDLDYNPGELDESDSDSSSRTKSETDSDSGSSEFQRPSKFRKTYKKNTIHGRTRSSQRRTKSQSSSSTDLQESSHNQQDNDSEKSIPSQETLPSNHGAKYNTSFISESNSSNWTSPSQDYSPDQIERGLEQDCNQPELTLDIQLYTESPMAPTPTGHHVQMSSEPFPVDTFNVTETQDRSNFGCDDSLYLKIDAGKLSTLDPSGRLGTQLFSKYYA